MALHSRARKIVAVGDKLPPDPRSKEGLLERCYLIPGIPARGAGLACASRWKAAKRWWPAPMPMCVSRALSAGRGDESLPLRLSRRSRPGLWARAQMRRRLSGSAFRPAVRPHRPACRCLRRLRRRSDFAAARRKQGRRCARVAPAPAYIQRARLEGTKPSAPTPRPKAHCWTRIARPDAGGARLLAEAAERMKFSARGYHRVLKVARTIADMAGGKPWRAISPKRYPSGAWP